MYTVTTIGVVMAAMNTRLLGLHENSTVGWSFFRDAVECIRSAIKRFKPNEDAVKAAREMVPDRASLPLGGDGYTEEHRALDCSSLEVCGFYDACEQLRERLSAGAKALAPLSSRAQ
jgi:hypothetical protein